MAVRTLRPDEQAIAQQIFQQGLDYDRVSVSARAVKSPTGSGNLEPSYAASPLPRPTRSRLAIPLISHAS